MKKKLTLVVSLLLVMALSIGGTLAYLTAETEAVTNTFTFGNINITLTETDEDNVFDGLVPGAKVAKDPVVTVVSGSEECYVFVKIEEANNSAGDGEKYINWAVDTANWEAVEGETGVYKYKTTVDASSAAQELYVLQPGDSGTDYENGYVTVDGENVTKEYIDNLTQNTYPKLTITAYAVQSEGMTDAADAWAKAGF